MFLLPHKTCKEIISTMSKFWYSSKNKESSIYWKKWTLLGNTKSKRGLGFRDWEAFNKALLVKKIWRIIKNPKSLAGQILKSKYFLHTSILDSKLGHNLSLMWRSIRSSTLLKNVWCGGLVMVSQLEFGTRNGYPSLQIFGFKPLWTHWIAMP